MAVMPPRFRLGTWLWMGLWTLCLSTGCVERRMVIATDPYGAVVNSENDIPIGATPVDHPFTYYGVYQFRLSKDGYETLVVQEKVRAPWYELPGLDFISENLIPWTIHDRRVFRYPLKPLQVMPPELLLQQAENLRIYGQGIGEPAPPLPDRPALMPPADNDTPPTR
jgi:PEGA domain